LFKSENEKSIPFAWRPNPGSWKTRPWYERQIPKAGNPAHGMNGEIPDVGKLAHGMNDEIPEAGWGIHGMND